MNLGMLLKMLGVKISPEDLAKIEATIPQLPKIVQQMITVVNGFDERLRLIELSQLTHDKILLRILEGVENARSDSSSDIRAAGIGATELAGVGDPELRNGSGD